MQLKEQWIREGFSSYYVVKKEQKLTYEKNILCYHTLSCLLPCEFRIQDEEEYYYYETGIYTPLKDKINAIDPKLFFAYLLEAFEDIEAYLLELDHLKLAVDLIFLDKESWPVFCYLPEYEKNIYDQLRGFLEQCIEMISGNDKKKVRFYYEFHSFLVKEKPNMDQMKEYLEIRPKVQKQEIKSIEETTESEWMSEMIDKEEISDSMKSQNRLKNRLIKIICVIIGIISIFLMGYFIFQIFRYGFYYLFLIGFAAALIGMSFSVYGFYKLWKRNKNSRRNVDSYTEKEHLTVLLEDEKTTLLEDNEKTVLLMEEPIGKLISKNHELKEIALTDDGFIIGSSMEGTDYQLEGTGISRRHIRFYKESGHTYCEDLDSTNGVMVNGRKIKTAVLQEGDRIKIGLEEFVFKEG